MFVKAQYTKNINNKVKTTVTHTKIFMTAGLILVSGFAASCGSKTTDDPAFDCDNPLAEAGEDISVSLGSAVTLDGGESAWCSSMAEEAIYNWVLLLLLRIQVLPIKNFSDNRSLQASNPKFVPDVAGDYVVSLIVDLGDYTSAEDYVIISVSAGGTAPVADCGSLEEGSQSEYIGKIGEVVTLDGSESSMIQMERPQAGMVFDRSQDMIMP